MSNGAQMTDYKAPADPTARFVAFQNPDKAIAYRALPSGNVRLGEFATFEQADECARKAAQAWQPNEKDGE